MAFGFRRLPGRARNYEAVGTTDYAPGTVLSRRQYDAYVSRLGRRQHLPGYEQIRETERRLEELAAELERRARAAQSEFEREAIAQARESAARERKALTTAQRRRAAQAAGQRRYNTFVKLLRGQRAEAGEPVSYREAQSEVRGVLRDLRSKNPDRRAAAIEAMGGGEVFREAYAAAYGRFVDIITNARGEIFNRVRLPSGRTVIQRAA